MVSQCPFQANSWAQLKYTPPISGIVPIAIILHSATARNSVLSKLPHSKPLSQEAVPILYGATIQISQYLTMKSSQSITIFRNSSQSRCPSSLKGYSKVISLEFLTTKRPFYTTGKICQDLFISLTFLLIKYGGMTMENKWLLQIRTNS